MVISFGHNRDQTHVAIAGKKPMPLELHPAQLRAAPNRAFVHGLIRLAEDTDRAGLRHDATALLAMVYALLDSESEKKDR